MYELSNNAPVATPVAITRLLPSDTSTNELRHDFARKLGSLMYGACATRPDTAYAQSYLGQFCKNPGPEHISAVERTLTYACQTRHLAIEYSAPANATDETYLVWNTASNTSFADDLATRRLTEDILITLFDGAIDWKARSQVTVTTSTTEAELLALSHYASDAQWWKRFFSCNSL